MRMSDWSSDVCSSDLFIRQQFADLVRGRCREDHRCLVFDHLHIRHDTYPLVKPLTRRASLNSSNSLPSDGSSASGLGALVSCTSCGSEERRVGKRWVRSVYLSVAA